MSIQEERQTARILASSLESTQKGLAALLVSLKGAGFHRAVQPYQQLEQVLIQQRLWSRSHRRDELNPLWRQLAETVRAIDAILGPFAAIMSRLKSLDRIEPSRANMALTEIVSAPPERLLAEREAAASPTPLPTPDDDLFETWLAEMTISRARLALKSGEPPAALQAHLRALAEAGLIERRGWGRGLVYRLSPETRRCLARAWAALADAEEATRQVAPPA